MQMIFQDPYASLNPRMTVGRSWREPLRSLDLVAEERAGACRSCSSRRALRPITAPLPARVLGRAAPAHRHRARLALEPRLIVCDEPVSALDVSIQAQIINLMQGLQRELGLTYLFIAHDLAVVRAHQRSRRGHVPGQASWRWPTRACSTRDPLHPYTKALISAVPIPDPKVERTGRILLSGDVPSPITNPPAALPPALPAGSSRAAPTNEPRARGGRARTLRGVPDRAAGTLVTRRDFASIRVSHRTRRAARRRARDPLHSPRLRPPAQYHPDEGRKARVIEQVLAGEPHTYLNHPGLLLNSVVLLCGALCSLRSGARLELDHPLPDARW